MTKLLMAAVAVLLSAALFTCAGIAPASQIAASQRAVGPSFTGDGGKGMSLAVLIPSAQGLAADQNYLPTMVQGVLVSDLTKHSAISVLDRLRLEAVLRETESGIYRNEADYGRLGQIANVDYALTGSITRTGSGYAMQIQVVGTGRNTIGITKAAYSGTCTIAEFDNFTGIRKASLELLTQMGVALTASARNELSGAAQAYFVNAQTSLAQGIVSQRGGNIAETMGRFYDAAGYDPSLTEAVTRANSMSATVRTGSLGENLRNDLAWQAEWRKILNDARTYLQNQRFVVARVRYDRLRQGKINYQSGIAEYIFNVWIKGAPYPQACLKLIADINSGLRATGRNRDWKLNELTWEDIGIGGAYSLSFSFQANLINSNGRSVASDSIGSDYIQYFWMDFWESRNWELTHGRNGIYYSTEDHESDLLPFLRPDLFQDINKEFKFECSLTVRAADITDVMTVQLTYSGAWPVQVTNLSDGSTVIMGSQTPSSQQRETTPASSGPRPLSTR
jgi:TolB-like protein